MSIEKSLFDSYSKSNHWLLEHIQITQQCLLPFSLRLLHPHFHPHPELYHHPYQPLLALQLLLPLAFSNSQLAPISLASGPPPLVTLSSPHPTSASLASQRPLLPIALSTSTMPIAHSLYSIALPTTTLLSQMLLSSSHSTVPPNRLSLPTNQSKLPCATPTSIASFLSTR